MGRARRTGKVLLAKGRSSRPIRKAIFRRGPIGRLDQRPGNRVVVLDENGKFYADQLAPLDPDSAVDDT